MMSVYLSGIFLTKIICLFEKVVKARNIGLVIRETMWCVASFYFFYRLDFIKMFNGKLFQVAMQVSLQLRTNYILT
jgi:hypothetical protein